MSASTLFGPVQTVSLLPETLNCFYLVGPVQVEVVVLVESVFRTRVPYFCFLSLFSLTLGVAGALLRAYISMLFLRNPEAC
jgi:hypothetical protein